jgi:hypothetical protein
MTRFGRVLPEHSVRPRHPAERTSRPDAPSRDQALKFIRDAVAGQEWAWRELYRRYNPLIVSVARPYRLSKEAVDDVSQNVWGLLFTHLEGIREPLALPGWIVTTIPAPGAWPSYARAHAGARRSWRMPREAPSMHRTRPDPPPSRRSLPS